MPLELERELNINQLQVHFPVELARSPFDHWVCPMMSPAVILRDEPYIFVPSRLQELGEAYVFFRGHDVKWQNRTTSRNTVNVEFVSDSVRF
ncbi:hypothetical protein AVEN_203436-1 [Araneus ventricosus]|uniref:Uncharacterized protein n=1 Tax=Araneus ventricosus TaxID=182803 RepID=A0A4Y2BJ43_ARAVE|nr:hypothetical protein AVEN_203436-1 [Araneus ventricosus]